MRTFSPGLDALGGRISRAAFAFAAFAFAFAAFAARLAPGLGMAI